MLNKTPILSHFELVKPFDSLLSPPPSQNSGLSKYLHGNIILKVCAKCWYFLVLNTFLILLFGGLNFLTPIPFPPPLFF